MGMEKARTHLEKKIEDLAKDLEEIKNQFRINTISNEYGNGKYPFMAK